jgi:hypothetical protein
MPPTRAIAPETSVEEYIMNSYEAKQARRRARLEAAASRAAAESERRSDVARAAIEHIPPGQPILVGHHSERRHRSDLARHDRNMRAAIDADKRAKNLAARAAAVGTGGISSDDPDAIQKLREELESLQARQKHMRAVNEAHRRYLKDSTSLDRSPLSESDKKTIRTYQPAYSWEPHPYPRYRFQNNGANIRRIEKRIAELEQIAARADQPSLITECSGYTVVRNFELNRLQLKFPGKPSESVRRLLKSNGFRWSPAEGAWQRMLNANAEFLVTQGYLRNQLEAQLTSPADNGPTTG